MLHAGVGVENEREWQQLCNHSTASFYSVHVEINYFNVVETIPDISVSRPHLLSHHHQSYSA
jgi:hypothetical protein